MLLSPYRLDRPFGSHSSADRSRLGSCRCLSTLVLLFACHRHPPETLPRMRGTVDIGSVVAAAVFVVVAAAVLVVDAVVEPQIPPLLWL